MSLSECDRITVPTSETHQFSFTRGNRPLTPQLSLDQAADAGEFAHSMELLRSTSLHLSLFRIDLPDLRPEDAFQVVIQAFGKRGMICRLPEDKFVLLLIGTDLDERIVDAETTDAINRVLCALFINSRLDIAAIHRDAPEMGDSDDVLLQLSALPARRQSLGWAA
jgi:hypothetical protein